MGTRNSCVFIGRLGADPELSYTPSGTTLAKFSLAVSEARKVEDTWEDETTWVNNITAFGKNAENVASVLGKGDLVLVETRFSPSRWTDDEGNTRYGFSFILTRWDRLMKKFTGDNGGEEEWSEVEDEVAEEVDDSELPF